MSSHNSANDEKINNLLISIDLNKLLKTKTLKYINCCPN